MYEELAVVRALKEESFNPVSMADRIGRSSISKTTEPLFGVD